MPEPIQNDEIYQILKMQFFKKVKIQNFSNVILNRSPGSLGPFWGPWGGPGAQIN